MENVKNASAQNLQVPLRNSGQTERAGSFFNDILSSSQNQLSLSGKYVRNLKTDKAGNFNKAYSFVKNDPFTKAREDNAVKDSKKSSERSDKPDKLDKYESPKSHKAKNQPQNDNSQKTLNPSTENQKTEIKNIADNTAEASEEKPLQSINKPALESESDNINPDDPLQGAITDQQIKQIAVLIADNMHLIRQGMLQGDRITDVDSEKFIENIKTEILDILKDVSPDQEQILPKLQEYMVQLTGVNQNALNNEEVSAEGIDQQIINSIFEKLIQDKSIQTTSNTSAKSEVKQIVDEEVLIIPDNTAKAPDISPKGLQNQLQLLKNDSDENMFSGDKSYIKDLIVSDKKISEQLMDFNSQKTFVQSSSSTAAPQPFISRNASFLQMVSKITEEIRLSVDNNKTQMIIKLEPETLGRLTVKISSENGIMNASFYAENDKAKTMIENHMAELRNSLEKQGIQIQNLTVTVDQSQQELTRHKNIMEAKNYSKNKGAAIKQINEIEISTPINPYFTQDLFNDLI